MAKAFDLIDGIKPEAVLADRAYDADRLMDAILDAGAEPVIPPNHPPRHPQIALRVEELESKVRFAACRSYPD